jgi:hypothetical protein
MNNLRERFEGWITETQPGFVNGWSPKVVFERIGGEYQNSFVKHSWQAYQAAHISAVKQCAEIAKEVMFTRGIAGTTTSKLLNEAIILLLPKENSNE